ncbi:MAG TPA: TonB-dependent receptor [Steroidobacteraceae bacterium]|nr:TonB-dependent receptor [Steroidobacteraceae bacterium]
MNEYTPSRVPECGNALDQPLLSKGGLNFQPRGIQQAIRLALAACAGTAAAFSGGTAHAADSSATATDDQSLEEVVVTGSRIRRVDTETASPVLTVDSSLIQNSGAQTAGDLAMMLPDVNGAATTGSTNNGGGFGESNIELRGLDAKRTLILIDGRRFGVAGSSDAVDIAQIPLGIIDHVEVLKEGAGAVYGSDAVAGVVNFITRKDVQGAEVTADYGRTTADDGAHRQFTLSFGDHTDKLDFLFSGRYQKQDAVLEGRRDFSKFALYNSSNSIYAGGSSRTPTGRIYLPTATQNPNVNAAALALQDSCDSASLTKIAGAVGSSVADYRCFNSGGASDDHYNYAPLNYLMTPQERGGLFSSVNYAITDDVSAYAHVLYNRTHSGFQEASLPFDSVSDNVVISQYSMYNPFGVDFGGGTGVNTDAEWRLLGLGPRRSDTTTETANVAGGLKGNLFHTGWSWDLYASYDRADAAQRVDGYFFSGALAQALGPSMLVNGTPTCVSTPGDASTAIAGCTPINIFAVNDPTAATAADVAAMAAISTNYNTSYLAQKQNISFDVQGSVFTLPAGEAQADIGLEHSYIESKYLADQIVIAQPPLYVSCEISQEACTGNVAGHYSNTDFFGELLVPVLKDVPGAKSLNVDLGVRLSDYSVTGNTTKATFKLEYKPISDLLVRGTFAQIYRVGTINDYYAAPVNTSATFTDPCDGLTAAKVAATPGLARACVGVPLDGSFAEANSQITGLITSNPDLKPESGNVITGGFIYEPSYVPGFSVDVDYWRYQIDNVITTLDPNYAIKQCIANGSFCDLVNRFPTGGSAGQIQVFQLPTSNLGTLKTSGIDLGVKYALDTGIGKFKASVDVTHVMDYSSIIGGDSTQYAGTYSVQYGNDTKWRGLAMLGYTVGGLDVMLTEQFINKIILPDGSPGSDDTVVKVPSIWYTNLSAGYAFGTGTRIQAGLDNLTNRNPPILYQNNVLNANTDVSTYDTLGRRWFLSITQKF